MGVTPWVSVAEPAVPLLSVAEVVANLIDVEPCTITATGVSFNRL